MDSWIDRFKLILFESYTHILPDWIYRSLQHRALICTYAFVLDVLSSPKYVPWTAQPTQNSQVSENFVDGYYWPETDLNESTFTELPEQWRKLAEHVAL